MNSIIDRKVQSKTLKGDNRWRESGPMGIDPTPDERKIVHCLPESKNFEELFYKNLKIQKKIYHDVCSTKVADLCVRYTKRTHSLT